MSKTNLFTLFITVILVVIAAEFLVNDYGADGAASVMTDGESQQDHDWASEMDQAKNTEEDEEKISVEEIGARAEGELESTTLDFNAAEDFDLSNAGNSVTNAPEAEITFGLIGLSGFQNVTLQRVPFNGILFERIDLRDFKSVPVVQQNLLQNNKERVASFHELHGDSDLLAGEIYLLIKEKAAAGLNVHINETNSYGEKSFFINYGDRQGSAFLVVKMRSSVYALTYEKGLHAYIESLVSYLNT